VSGVWPSDQPAAGEGSGADAPGGEFRSGLRDRARALGRRIVLPEGEDPRTCLAALQATRKELFHPVLLGSAERVGEMLAQAGADPGAIEVVDPVRARTLICG
jgi:phosphate acetyltransferase